MTATSPRGVRGDARSTRVRGMGATATALAAALVTVALCAAVPSAQAYVHHRTVHFNASAYVYYFSEGPMFASGSGPFGSGGDSTIGVDVVLTQPAPDPVLGGVLDSGTVINLAFFDEDNAAAMGWIEAEGGDFPDMCCTRTLLEAGECSEAGSLVVRMQWAPPGAAQPSVYRYDFPGTELDINRTHVVTNAGVQMVMVAVCDKRGAAVPDATAQFTYSFRNPYGFVPGLWYALLPFYGFLAIAYLVMLIVYLGVFVKNRSMLLPLQYCVLAVVILGATEATATFFMFLSKNDSGVAPCCPVTGDFMAAVVLRVVKTTLSRVLLLAVCLGFGVVRPRLSRRITGVLTLLAGAYLGCSLIADIIRASDTAVSQTLWDFFVLILNFFFLFWIYSALMRIREELTQRHQTAKLEMYDSLWKTLKIMAGVWGTLSVLMILFAMGFLPVPWRWLWLVDKFWDGLYFVVLLVIAYIWAPSERAMQYSLYSNVGADADTGAEMVGVGIGEFEGDADSGGSGARAGTGSGGGAEPGDGDEAEFRLGGSDDDDDDAEHGARAGTGGGGEDEHREPETPAAT